MLLPEHTNSYTNMNRRTNGNLKVIAVVAVAGLFLYGLYSYHDLHTRFNKSEEKADRLRQQHDSISAQLQVVYEHKSRLENTLQQEKQSHSQTKRDLTDEKQKADTKFYSEKQELLARINVINSEHKMVQGQHEDLENEFGKQQSQFHQLEEDHKKMTEKALEEYMQLKQEKENAMARLLDELADLKRRHTDLESKYNNALQQVQYQQNNAIPQIPQKPQLPAFQPLPGNQPNAAFNQQPIVNMHQAGANIQFQPQVLPGQNFQLNKPLPQKPVPQRPDSGNIMQLQGPGGDPNAYFKPKSAVQDHDVQVNKEHLDGQGQGQGQDEEHKDVQLQQVVPPNVNENKNPDRKAMSSTTLAPTTPRDAGKELEHNLFAPLPRVQDTEDKDDEQGDEEERDEEHGQHMDNLPAPDGQVVDPKDNVADTVLDKPGQGQLLEDSANEMPRKISKLQDLLKE